MLMLCSHTSVAMQMQIADGRQGSNDRSFVRPSFREKHTEPKGFTSASGAHTLKLSDCARPARRTWLPEPASSGRGEKSLFCATESRPDRQAWCPREQASSEPVHAPCCVRAHCGGVAGTRGRVSTSRLCACGGGGQWLRPWLAGVPEKSPLPQCVVSWLPLGGRGGAMRAGHGPSRVVAEHHSLAGRLPASRGTILPRNLACAGTHPWSADLCPSFLTRPTTRRSAGAHNPRRHVRQPSLRRADQPLRHAAERAHGRRTGGTRHRGTAPWRSHRHRRCDKGCVSPHRHPPASPRIFLYSAPSTLTPLPRGGPLNDHLPRPRTLTHPLQSGTRARRAPLSTTTRTTSSA